MEKGITQPAMETIATIIGFASGFALMGYRESAATLLVTSLAVDASLAPLTAVIAMRRGRATVLWTILGFAFGMWALAAVLMLPASRPKPRPTVPDYPPTSDAA